MTQPWRLDGKLSVGRSYCAAAELEEKIYVVAGCLTEKNSTGEVFDLKSKTWEPMRPTLAKRDSTRVVAYDDFLYAVGG